MEAYYILVATLLLGVTISGIVVWLFMRLERGTLADRLATCADSLSKVIGDLQTERRRGRRKPKKPLLPPPPAA